MCASNFVHIYENNSLHHSDQCLNFNLFKVPCVLHLPTVLKSVNTDHVATVNAHMALCAMFFKMLFTKMTWQPRAECQFLTELRTQSRAETYNYWAWWVKLCKCTWKRECLRVCKICPSGFNFSSFTFFNCWAVTVNDSSMTTLHGTRIWHSKSLCCTAKSRNLIQQVSIFDILY